MRRKTAKPTVFDQGELAKELKREARAVGLSEDTARVVSERVAEKVASWVSDKDVITQDDLHRRIAREVKQYSQDLAYVYENRGKII